MNSYKAARKAAGLTQRQAYEALNLRATMLARIEAGRVEPSPALKAMMCDLYMLRSDDPQFAQKIYSDQELTDEDRAHIEALDRRYGQGGK